MKNLLLLSAFLILMFGCIKQKDDTTTTTKSPAVKPKVTLMVANQIWVNNRKQQMIKISVRYKAEGLHNWNDLELSEGFQNFTGYPTYHNAGILPLDEYGAHQVQLFFSDGGMAIWNNFSFTQNKSVYLRAFTNSNRNGAIIQLDGLDADEIDGF